MENIEQNSISIPPKTHSDVPNTPNNTPEQPIVPIDVNLLSQWKHIQGFDREIAEQI